MNNKNSTKMANISQKWLEVLIPFSFDYRVRLTASEISRKSGTPLRTISRTLNKLVEINLLRYHIDGKNKKYYLDLEDRRVCILINLIESYKSYKYSLDVFLWKEINPLMEFGTLVLFGSQVKGYATEESDIDVVIFARNSKKLKDVLRNLYKVQAHVISFEEFEKLLFNKKVLASEIVGDHVVFGDISRFVDLCRRYYHGKN